MCNLLGRPQASNAAFNTWGTHPFQEGFEEADGTIVLSPVEAQPPVDTFTDALGWVPGVEVRLDLPGIFYFRDYDASVVVPSHEGTPYTWRIVYPDGTPATDWYGGPFGTGNPADQDVEIGTNIEIVNDAHDSSWATVHIWNSRTTPTRRGR